MFDIDSYMICGKDFEKEIAALESYMDELQTNIAFESSGSVSNEPDGTRLRNAYKDLANAKKTNDQRKIDEASREVNAASSEIDQKIKDPEKKKKIIKLAIAAASAAALTVGAIVVANDLKKGDTSKIRGAVDVARKAINKIKSSTAKPGSSNKLKVNRVETVSFDSIKNYAKSSLNVDPTSKVGISIVGSEEARKSGLDPSKKYLAKGVVSNDGNSVKDVMEIIEYTTLEPKLQSLLDKYNGTVVIKS